MKKLILKFLYLVATVKHSNIRKDYRYFIRDNYYSRLRQIQFFFKDRVVKKPYKTVEYQGEFDQELRFALPYAYWHHLNGTLKTTISSKHTKELYFFSENHEEKYEFRNWQSGFTSFEIPNMIHNVSFSYQKWVQVPLKAKYKNDIFKYEKPMLVIANKYNIEWDLPPINFLDLTMLEWIIKEYSSKYQIIYNRPLNSQIVSDNSEILDLKEHAWLHQHYPDVIQINDLYNQNITGVNSFNHLQLLLYANCNHFISVHGGTSTLASYFGGNNVIFSKRGIEHELNEYSTIFPKLSGAKIHHAKTEEQVKIFMRDHY